MLWEPGCPPQVKTVHHQRVLKEQRLPLHAGILLIPIPSLRAGEAQLTSLMDAQESFSISASLSLQSIITRQKQGLLIKINKANHYFIRVDDMNLV